MIFSLRRAWVVGVFFAVGMVAAEVGAQTGAGTQRTLDKATVALSNPGAGPSASRPTSTPYAGDLSIFEYPDRDKKLQVDRVMDLLGIVKGKNVADIGAGSGWFSVRAAKRVGGHGSVLAEDINPKAIDYVAQRAAQEKL